MYDFSNLCKIELENEICCLFSTHPVSVNISFQHTPYSGMTPLQTTLEFSRMFGSEE